jgi:hypothetical protein
MTLEERVGRLEQRVDSLERIEQRLENVERAVVGLREDFNASAARTAATLERILATLQELQRRPLGFHWPWERFNP